MAKQALKLKNIFLSNWRNKVKFLVASLQNVNEAALSMVQSIRFDCLKILWTEVGINLEVNWLCLCDLAHEMFVLTLLF